LVDTSSSDTGSPKGWDYGVLGSNFLEEYVLELDFEKRRVRFLDADEYQVPKRAEGPNEVVLPIRLGGKRPFVEIELNGKREYVLFDTGSPATLTVSGRTAEKFGIDVKHLPDFGEWGTARGPISVHFYEADRLRFAGFDLDVTPVVVAPHGWYNMAGSNDSVIGIDIIRQFTIRIDYPRKRMWLRRERTKTTYLGVDYELTRESGVFVYPFPGGLVVTGTRPDSPSAEIGLLPGDLIDSTFNGQRDLRAVLERVAQKERIHIVRELEDGTIADLAVPELDEDELATAARLAREAAVEFEKKRIERWKLQRDEQLYTRTASGWVVVDGYRRRQGPKQGEEWLNFEEMRNAKAAEGAAE
jgi:predicted aspartyl protease